MPVAGQYKPAPGGGVSAVIGSLSKRLKRRGVLPRRSTPRFCKLGLRGCRVFVAYVHSPHALPVSLARIGTSIVFARMGSQRHGLFPTGVRPMGSEPGMAVQSPEVFSKPRHVGKPASNAIELERAEYRYRGSRSRPPRHIGPVSLAVSPGERVALIGPNGCGKSTVLHMMCGASTPIAGRVRCFGGVPAAEARRRIGVVFQSPALDELLTVRETLCLAGRLLQIEGASLSSAAASSADRLGLTDRLADRVGTLSGGYKRRVDLARAIVHVPDVVLLDEPTAGLDDESAKAFNEMLNALSTGGMTIIQATHTLEEVRLASRVVVMLDGQVAMQTSAAQGTDQLASGSVRVSGGLDGLAEAMRELNAIPEPDGSWTWPIAEADDASVGRVVRAAARFGASVTVNSVTMQSLYDDAERARATEKDRAEAPDRAGGEL